VIAGEPELMFLTEFRKPASYYSVIHAISKGRLTPSDIGQMLDMKTDLVSHMLGKLTLLGFITKDEPFGKGKTKDVHYVIKDRLLASYFRFIYPAYKEMTGSDIDDAYDYIVTNLSQYLGHVFEDICMEYVLKHGYSKAGKWWSGPMEIDVIASNESTVLLAECKYRNELTDADLIDELLEKSEFVNPNGLSKRYALFSKSGFTKVAELRAKSDRIELFSLEKMFQ